MHPPVVEEPHDGPLRPADIRGRRPHELCEAGREFLHGLSIVPDPHHPRGPRVGGRGPALHQPGLSGYFAPAASVNVQNHRAVTCGQSVRFTEGSEGMGLERRAAIAEHRSLITTPARSSSWVASPRQPIDGIVTNRATRWSCTTRLGSLIRGHNRPPEEVTLAV